VDYRHGLRHASGQRGTFDAEPGRLALAKGRPMLEEQGTSRLTAERIEIETASGDVEARGGAQQTLLKGGVAPGLVGGAAGTDQQPTLISSRSLTYEARTRTTLYDGEALMRSGRSEVRAERLRQVEDAQGRRRIEAEGGVSSRLQPGAAKSGGKEPVLVEVEAQAMVYDEAQKQVVYTGDVDLRQGPIATHSPRATLFLAADGHTLEKLVAGEPVQLKEGQRRADGRLATYELASETITIEGEPVRLVGPGQDVQGRSLTFHVGDDRILVHGREEGRTETVFRKEPVRP
jgi:lipopolysaccharide transport protein LptA